MRNGFAHFVRKVFARRKLLPGKFWVFAPLPFAYHLVSKSDWIKAGWHATTLTQKLTSSHLTLLNSGHSTYKILRIMMQILLFSKPSLTNLALHKQAMTGSVMCVYVFTQLENVGSPLIILIIMPSKRLVSVNYYQSQAHCSAIFLCHLGCEVD